VAAKVGPAQDDFAGDDQEESDQGGAESPRTEASASRSRRAPTYWV
jgi:hypothetical protein